MKLTLQFFSENIESEMNPQQEVVGYMTFGVRRSERLLRKRNFRNRSIINDCSDDLKKLTIPRKKAKLSIVKDDLDDSNQSNTTIKTKKRKILRSYEFPKAQHPDVVVTRQQAEKLLPMVQKPQNANRLTSPTVLDNDPQILTTDGNHLKMSSNEACGPDAVSKPEADADGERTASTETASIGDLSQQSLLSYGLEELERATQLLNESLNMLSMIGPNSVLDDNYYSESTTSSMPTESQIVTDDNSSCGKNFSSSHRNVDDKFTIYPLKKRVLYEKTNLKDLMDEISKLMPSWSLTIVNDPSPKYVISQMSIGTNGVPVVNKSIVLDKYFMASVYINQSLQYYYRKRYTSAAKIVKLIKRLTNFHH